MIVIVDYEMGNLRSVQKALEKSGGEAVISQDPKKIAAADKVVLPGVGAMPPAMERLTQLGLVDTLKTAVVSGKPFLGICLGLQLLFEESDEGKNGSKGLSILKGRVERFSGVKVPHMGWNQITLQKADCPLFKGIASGENVYFCHSYYVRPVEASVVATSTGYGKEFASSVWKENVFGVQFHPEKSQAVGLKILRNFVELAR